MIIDLSHSLFSGMPVYPGDPETVFTPSSFHEREGFSVYSLRLGSHAGTHIDSPVHFLPGGMAADDPRVLEACIGPAIVCDAACVHESGEITLSDMEIPLENISPGERILIATGWSERYGMDGFHDRFPSVSKQLAEQLIEWKITLLGVETPSLHASKSAEIHTMLLSAGIVIVENLANLRCIAGKRVFFSAAPLKLRGIDGSPVRAYAVI